VGEGRRSIVTSKLKSRVESKRVQAFQDMSDEELERYVNGDKGLDG
jgi:hypothetical protein